MFKNLCTYLLFNLVISVNLVRSNPYIKCMEIYKPESISMMCCKPLQLTSNSTEVCMKSRMDPCVQARCEMNKFKLIDKSGEVDERAANLLLEKFEKEHPLDKEMSQRVRSFCLDGQFKDYVPANQEVCNPIRFLICGYVHAMVECSHWNPAEECRAVAATAAQCRIALTPP